MKKSILLLTASSVILSATILGCNNLTKNAKNAQEKISKGNKDIDKTNQEYVNDIEYYRKETAKTIESNSQNIIAFKAKIDPKKKRTKLIINIQFSNWNYTTAI